MTESKLTLKGLGEKLEAFEERIEGWMERLEQREVALNEKEDELNHAIREVKEVQAKANVPVVSQERVNNLDSNLTKLRMDTDRRVMQLQKDVNTLEQRCEDQRKMIANMERKLQRNSSDVVSLGVCVGVMFAMTLIMFVSGVAGI